MGRVRVKFCGLVRPEDVRQAVEVGCEYLGFVFATESPRSVSPEHVENLLRSVDTRDTLRVGVFRDQPAMFVNEVVRRCRLDLVQLHGCEPRDYPDAIRVPVLRVLRVRAFEVAGSESTVTALGERMPLAPNVAGVLLDAADAAGRSGGLGLVPEPAALEAVRRVVPEGVRVFLSGGLTPENVASRVRALRPWAVDVSSGIESVPGVKDPKRMAAFVAAVEGAG